MTPSQAFVTTFLPQIPQHHAVNQSTFTPACPTGTRTPHPRRAAVMSLSPHRSPLRHALLKSQPSLPTVPSTPSSHPSSSTPFPITNAITNAHAVALPRSSPIHSLITRTAVAPIRLSLALITRLAKRLNHARRHHRTAYAVSRMALSVSLACVTYLITRTAMPNPLAIASPPALPQLPFRLPTLSLPPRLTSALRPFSESFGVVFLSEFGDKSMFATALMAMKYNPLIVCIGALAALTIMTFIACFLGQLMHYLPATVTHYSSIALFVFFGVQMLLQARHLPSSPGGVGGERADAEEMVAGATLAQVDTKPLAVLAKVASLIFVAEWCDRSMLATMALAASNNTVAVIGGATFANIICTGFAVFAATLVASRISERVVALTAGLLFEVFAVFTYLEGPEG